MTKPYILGIDPSGSFNEGKGTTGFALIDPEGNLDKHSYIMAKDYSSQLEYWQAVLAHIDFYLGIHRKLAECKTDLVVSLEDYVLYASAAKSQISSEMETSKLIGAITMYAYELVLPTYIRNAAQVKNRWSNSILEHKGLITKSGTRYVDNRGKWINKHCLDAIRHALHCHYFEVGKKEALA